MDTRNPGTWIIKMLRMGKPLREIDYGIGIGPETAANDMGGAALDESSSSESLSE